MSAIPVYALETVQVHPKSEWFTHQLQWSTQQIHVELVQKLQGLARGVSRKRRSTLHQQFAQEWRLFATCGGALEDMYVTDYPLLQALWVGEPQLS